jgi:FlgD Ig-like domain
MYGVSGIPHAQFQGTISEVGGGTNMLPYYTTHYNSFVNNESSFEIELDLNVADSQIELTAAIEVTGTVNPADLNKLVCIITYDYGPGYTCSAQRYEELDFELTAIGETETFEVTFDAESDWDLAKIRGVAWIQKMDGTSGNYPIHQAAVLGYPFVAINPLANLEMNINSTETFDLTDYFSLFGAPVPADITVESSDPAIVEAVYADNDLTLTSFGSGGSVQIDIYGSYDGYNGISSFAVFVINPNDHFIVILDLDPTPTGSTLKTAVENNYSDGNVYLTSDVTAYPFSESADAIFVLLGVWSTNHILTEGEAGPLVTYMDNGGNLYMEGADTWFYDTPTSLHPYFKIFSASDGLNDLSTVVGHDFLEGFSWTYSGLNWYIDPLEPLEDAVVIFSNPTVGYDCGVAYDSGTYKTVGTSFEITGLGGTNTLDDAVNGIVNFFGIGGTPLAPPSNLAVDALTGLLTWEAPETEDVTGYDVYLDDAFVENTSDLEWIYTDLINGTIYEAGVAAVHDEGASAMVTLEFTYEGTGAGNNLPLVTEIIGNYPNPFNPVTNISYSVKEVGNVTLEVYNLKGQLVKTLVNDIKEAGEFTTTWSGTDNSNKSVSSGVYFYKMKAGNYQETKKMILIK